MQVNFCDILFQSEVKLGGKSAKTNVGTDKLILA